MYIFRLIYVCKCMVSGLLFNIRCNILHFVEEIRSKYTIDKRRNYVEAKIYIGAQYNLNVFFRYELMVG